MKQKRGGRRGLTVKQCKFLDYFFAATPKRGVPVLSCNVETRCLQAGNKTREMDAVLCVLGLPSNSMLFASFPVYSAVEQLKARFLQGGARVHLMVDLSSACYLDFDTAMEVARRFTTTQEDLPSHLISLTVLKPSRCLQVKYTIGATMVALSGLIDRKFPEDPLFYSKLACTPLLVTNKRREAEKFALTEEFKCYAARNEM